MIENNKNGKLVKVNNIDELVNAMDEILENQDFAREIGKNAKKIANVLAPEVINRKWEKYIKEIGKGKK